MIKLKSLEGVLQQVDLFDEPSIDFEQYPTQAHIASRMCFLIESRNQDFSNKTVIDLGCGTGMLAIGAALCNASHVVGIDVDSSALKIARNNIDNLPLEESSIDLIQCDALQLIPNVSLLLEKFKKVHKQQNGDNKQKANKHNKNKRKNKHKKGKFGSTRANTSDNSSIIKTLPKEYKDRLMEILADEKINSFYKSCDCVVMNPPFGTKLNTIHCDLIFLKIAIDMSRNVVYSLHKSSTRDYLINTLKNVFHVKSVEIMAQLKYDLPKSYKFHKQASKDINVDLLRIDVSNLAKSKIVDTLEKNDNNIININNNNNNTNENVANGATHEWENHLFVIVRFLGNRDICTLLSISHSFHSTLSNLSYLWRQVIISHETCLPNWSRKTNFVNIASLFHTHPMNLMKTIRNSIVILNIDLTSFIDLEKLDFYLLCKSKSSTKNEIEEKQANTSGNLKGKKSTPSKQHKHKQQKQLKHSNKKQHSKKKQQKSNKSSNKSSSIGTDASAESKKDDLGINLPRSWSELDKYLAFENDFEFSKIGNLANLKSLSIFFHHWPSKHKNNNNEMRMEFGDIWSTKGLLERNKNCARLTDYHPFAKTRKDKQLAMESYYNIKCELLSVYGKIESEIELFLQQNQQISHFECIFDFIKKYENVLFSMPNLHEIIVDSSLNTFNSAKLATKPSLCYLSGLMNDSFVNPQWFGGEFHNLKYLDIGIENKSVSLKIFYQVLRQLYKANIKLTGLSIFLVHLIGLFDNKKNLRGDDAKTKEKMKRILRNDGALHKNLLELDLIVSIWTKYLDLCMIKKDENESLSEKDDSKICSLEWFNLSIMYKSSIEYEVIRRNEIISYFIFRVKNAIVECLKNSGISLASVFNKEYIKFTLNNRSLFVRKYCKYPIFHDTIELAVNKYKFGLLDEQASLFEMYKNVLNRH